MSILVVRVVPQGIIMAADRNITITEKVAKNPNYIGERLGQMQHKKIIRWPNGKVVIGAVGEAKLGGKLVYDWLYSFMGKHIEFESLEKLALDLKDEIDKQPEVKDWFENKQEFIIHIAGFEKKDCGYLPFVWFVRNVDGFKDGKYTGHSEQMLCTEEFWKYHTDKKPEQLKEHFMKEEVPFTWFHQGYDISTFNTLALNVEKVIGFIEQTIQNKSGKKVKLEDWYPHVSMMINTYASYFQSFYPPYKQYVGGGVDVEGVEWPIDE